MPQAAGTQQPFGGQFALRSASTVPPVKKVKKKKKARAVGAIRRTPSFAAKRTTKDHQPNQSSMGAMVEHD